MAAGIVQLFAWGLVVGLAMRRGWVPALVVALVDVGLGLVIVTLKVAVLRRRSAGPLATRPQRPGVVERRGERPRVTPRRGRSPGRRT